MNRSRVPCSWEASVARATALPDPLDATLTEHLAACDSCREVAHMAAMLHGAETAPRNRSVPPAALVWHRAQMRARRDTAIEAARPIVAMQLAAGAIALLVVVLLLSSLAPTLATAAEAGWREGVGLALRLGDALVELTQLPSKAGTDASLARTAVPAVGLGGLLMAAAFLVSRLADRTPRS